MEQCKSARLWTKEALFLVLSKYKIGKGIKSKSEFGLIKKIFCFITNGNQSKFKFNVFSLKKILINCLNSFGILQFASRLQEKLKTQGKLHKKYFKNKNIARISKKVVQQVQIQLFWLNLGFLK